MATILRANGLRAGLPTRRSVPGPSALRSPTGPVLRPSFSMSTLSVHPRVFQKTTTAGKRVLHVTASAATPSPPAPAKPAFKWGANMKDLGICVGIATLLWFIPPPAGVTAKAWHLLAVFIGEEVA